MCRVISEVRQKKKIKNNKIVEAQQPKQVIKTDSEKGLTDRHTRCARACAVSVCVCVCVFLVGHWSVRYAELKQATHAQSNNRQTKNECIMK